LPPIVLPGPQEAVAVPRAFLARRGYRLVVPNPPPLPPLVLFDMDDTVFDHSLTCRDALSALRREYSDLLGLPLDRLWPEYLRLLDAQAPEIADNPKKYRDWRAERFRRLAALAGRELAPEQARDLSRAYREHYQRLRRPVPGAPEFVRRVARRARVGMVTNNEYAEQEEKLEFLGLSGIVDPLVVSGREGVAKPDPRIFHLALARAGAQPREAVMVGDSWTNDVLGALAAGIRPLWFNRFGTPRPPRPRVGEFGAFRPFVSLERNLGSLGEVRASRSSSRVRTRTASTAL
jgi:HAD superfamily hydrolase (TIGR01549 family)